MTRVIATGSDCLQREAGLYRQLYQARREFVAAVSELQRAMEQDRVAIEPLHNARCREQAAVYAYLDALKNLSQLMLDRR